MLTPPLKILRDALKFSGDGDVESAILILQNGIDLCEREPEHLAMLPRLTSNMVLFYRRSGQLYQALSAVRRTLLLCPDDRQMLHLHADLLLESGDISAAALAAVELRAVCERNPATFTADWADALSLLEKRITG
jgi:hypothetical protein